MSKWLALYTLETYEQFKEFGEMILCAEAKGYEKKDFFKIAKNDVVVYYAEGLVLGIFKVKSANTFYVMKNGKYYSAKMTERIALPENSFMDFKSLTRDAFFEVNIPKNIENGKSWCVLKEYEYETIENALLNSKYLREIKNEPNTYGSFGWKLDPDVSTGLLDYYNSRATSFSSLFVASFFGLVALAAIIQSLLISLTTDPTFLIKTSYGIVLVSFFVYMVFIMVGYHTLSTYFHYANLSETIKKYALTIPYQQDLCNLCRVHVKKKRKFRILKTEKKYYEANLKELIENIEAEHSRSWSRTVLKYKALLLLVYLLAFGALTIIIYWSIIPPDWQSIISNPIVMP